MITAPFPSPPAVVQPAVVEGKDAATLEVKIGYLEADKAVLRNCLIDIKLDLMKHVGVVPENMEEVFRNAIVRINSTLIKTPSVSGEHPLAP